MQRKAAAAGIVLPSFTRKGGPARLSDQARWGIFETFPLSASPLCRSRAAGWAGKNSAARGPFDETKEKHMSSATTQLDPTDGTTPVSLPTQDACCQSPCDPPWRTGPNCSIFTETKTSIVSLVGGVKTGDFGRGFVTI